MSKFIFSLIVIVLFAAAASAQTPTPEPTPVDDVVKISTSLIQLDVSVTDKNGKPISDIKAEEVEIYENGQKQKITGFSFISSVKEIEQKNLAKGNTQKNAIPVPGRTLRPEQIRRTFALVVDDLSLSFRSAYDTRRALKKFVDEQMQDGDYVAIVRTGAGVGALQQFTSDKRILYAAIEKVKWNPSGTGGMSAFAPLAGETNPMIGSDEIEEGMGGDMIEREVNSNRNTIFATGTLGALQFVVRRMAELPGRKSVILFSDGFALEEEDYGGNKSFGTVYDFMKKLIDLANRSSVTFYTIDARGLVVTGLTAADNIAASDLASDTTITDRQEQLYASQEGLAFLAEETGGVAFKNNNDMSLGVKRAIDDQSYYLVAYEPDDDTFDAKRKFNRLDVKVARKGAKVRYRSGFFNVADRETATNVAATVKTPIQTLQSALLSPFAVGGIGLHLNPLFLNTKEGTFVRSLLHVNARDLKFVDDAGMKKASFEVVAVSFGDTGQAVDQLTRSYTIRVKGAEYDRMLASGFVYHFTFPVKKPGAFQYRVALRDTQSGIAGSASQFIQVPNVKKSGLTLSSVVIESVAAGQPPGVSTEKVVSDPAADTALRRVKSGSVLRYGFEVYNSKLDKVTKRPAITTRIRMFRDGKLIYDGPAKPVDLADQRDLGRIKIVGALSLGDKLEPGDYILQAVINDPLAKEKQQIATQWVEFEVIE